MIKCFKHRTSWVRISVFVAIVVIGYIVIIINNILKDDDVKMSDVFDRSSQKSVREVETSVNRVLIRKLLNSSNSPEYPPDLFSLEERRKGAILLHVIGMVYMFLALAIVCDEFFIPALGVIIDVLNISEDVAGATFMAAGGSAPELFTSFIGLFAAKNNIGIGTIVGSAVFNILFVISMCAIVSKIELKLTWWPLFRDMSFYCLHLLILIFFYIDNKIEWYESTVLLICYVAYVVFMKFNERVSRFIKHILYRRCSKVNVGVSPIQTKLDGKGSTRSGKFTRSGVIELLIHAIDPLTEAHIRIKLARIKEIGQNLQGSSVATTTSICMMDSHSPSPQNDVKKTANGNINGNSIPTVNTNENVNVNINTISDGNSNIATLSNGKSDFNVSTDDIQSISNGMVPPIYNNSQQFSYQWNQSSNNDTKSSPLSNDSNQNITDNVSNSHSMENHMEHRRASVSSLEAPSASDEEKPLNLTWPVAWRKRIMYIIVAPIIFPLYITLPDVRVKKKRGLFVITFIGSILWIGGFSYLMVWWANQTGETAGIPVEVMGLTVLAAGTSIPDLITSVIVAKKGLGDMAVSSSVGSNIFDITVGLPLPWILYTCINGQAVPVSSQGLFCSIVLLFIVLIALLIMIIICKWTLNKIIGSLILILYAGYLTAALLLQYKIFVCPISTS